jgi:electron-transferring-flavoprotein dehydrogenase
MQHPYLWRHLKGGVLKSWGAKSLAESGRRGEPWLAGDGYARIGENSGSTNMLTGSGVDEAWATGIQLAQGVIELLERDEPFTRENLNRAYTTRRRASWVEKEGRVAEKARAGFQIGFIPGMIGMAMAGFTRGMLHLLSSAPKKREKALTPEQYYKGIISPEEIARIREDCDSQGHGLHNALMERAGWPSIPYDGKLLMSHQDALLIGGKVQAPEGYADHVVFVYPHLCEKCDNKACIEICSGQAIAPGPGGAPLFDREKCIHCGACVWSCTRTHPQHPERGAIDFRAGTGGLHSAEN